MSTCDGVNVRADVGVLERVSDRDPQVTLREEETVRTRDGEWVAVTGAVDVRVPLGSRDRVNVTVRETECDKEGESVVVTSRVRVLVGARVRVRVWDDETVTESVAVWLMECVGDGEGSVVRVRVTV